MNPQTLAAIILLITGTAGITAILMQLRTRRIVKGYAKEYVRLLKPVKAKIQLLNAQAAVQSGDIGHFATAIGVDVSDPMFSEMSLDEFNDIASVRVADLRKLIEGEGQK